MFFFSPISWPWQESWKPEFCYKCFKLWCGLLVALTSECLISRKLMPLTDVIWSLFCRGKQTQKLDHVYKQASKQDQYTCQRKLGMRLSLSNSKSSLVTTVHLCKTSDGLTANRVLSLCAVLASYLLRQVVRYCCQYVWKNRWLQVPPIGCMRTMPCPLTFTAHTAKSWTPRGYVPQTTDLTFKPHWWASPLSRTDVTNIPFLLDWLPPRIL